MHNIPVMTLEGKGYYMWQLPRCDDGDPVRIANRARGAGLSHVLIKIVDGYDWDYNVDKDREVDLVPPVLARLREAGVEVWGWHYVRGDYPVAEARRAIRRIKDLDVDGYVIDAEEEYRDWDKDVAAGRFMEELREHLPDLPMALSTYRYPRSHPALPYNVFLEYCDYSMPQVYFEQAHDPEAQLVRSVDQYMGLRHARPIIPTAPTYARGDWRPTPGEIQRLFAKAKEMELPAANAWSWDFAARQPYFDLYNAVATFEWSNGPSPELDMPERLVGRLNERDPDDVASLYWENAAHVTGERTVVGHGPIRAWYQTLLKGLLTEATFEITGKISSGSTRNFTWKAEGDGRRVLDGNDTLNVREGRILYHYTYFNLRG